MLSRMITMGMAVCVMLGMVTASAWSAVVPVVIPADSIRVVVVGAVMSRAVQAGLDIEADVPVLANMLVPGTNSPGIVVGDYDFTDMFPSLRVPVDLTDSDGTVVRSITVIVRVTLYETVAVAATDIRRGDPLYDDVVSFERCDITGFGDAYTSIDQLDGYRAGRTLRKGTILNGRNVEPIPVVQRGDRVIMKACVGNVEIIAKGTARENGGCDEYIRVYNETTRKTLKCRVVEAGLVLVGEGG